MDFQNLVVTFQTSVALNTGFWGDFAPLPYPDNALNITSAALNGSFTATLKLHFPIYNGANSKLPAGKSIVIRYGAPTDSHVGDVSVYLGGATPNPSPTTGPSPSPVPTTNPTPVPGQSEVYCPSANDLVAAYGTPSIVNQGWTVNQGGGVATKAAYNLLGGTVEYDVDFSGTKPGVNANIYTLSPKPNSLPASGFTQGNYCDGQKTGSEWCLEIDWIETNGNCGGATAVHTYEGPGVGCSAWGCTTSYHYNGRSKFHMKIVYDENGYQTIYRDNQLMPGMSPTPTANDWKVIQDSFKSRGAVLYSSQWVGWVPVEDCGTNGDLSSSTFSISNLRIEGKVVQGPTPTRCQ